MNDWLLTCRNWVERAYSQLPFASESGALSFRWVAENDLRQETSPESAGALALTDSDIGWLFFFLPYKKNQKISPLISQALGFRAMLAREANYTGQPLPSSNEDNGAWQIGLVWLVVKEDEAQWQEEMATLRHESGASEELSFDMVVLEGNAIEQALNRHGLPRLLLTCRQLIQKKANEVEQWLSADAQVAAKLANFSARFDTALERSHARWLEEQSLAKVTEMPVHPATPQLFEGFCVENFRNLNKLEISPPTATQESGVGSIVLFGPNGTGKSSLVEALSLAAFCRSQRSDKYHKDRDITRPSGERFVSSYLNKIDRQGGQPVFRWGSKEASVFKVSPPENAGNPEGVILDQDASRGFTELGADELAARVLRGYSELAQKLSDELDRRYDVAKQEKLTFFRRFDLNSGITRSETAYDRLARSVIEQVHAIPRGFLEWAERVGHFNDSDASKAKECASRWKHFQQLREDFAATLAKLQTLGAADATASSLRELLDSYNRIASETCMLLDAWEQRYSDLKTDEAEILAKMDAWGEFLARPKDPKESQEETKALHGELEKLAKERGSVEQRGKELSARLELLDQAQVFLKNHWVNEHGDTCPVCDSNIPHLDGIAGLVQELNAECRRVRDELRTRHASIAKLQKELEVQAKALASAICPVSSIDQEKLRKLLAPLQGGETLEALLADRQRREQLKSDLRYATRLISKPAVYPDTESESLRLANEFQKLCDMTDTVLSEPQALESVRKEYQAILREVLEQHLPETIGKVWGEIAHCLTSAHWLLPRAPAMRLERTRGQQGHRLTLRAGDQDLLARYLFNAAELHTLGLAWFFTLHLARRRFEHAWIALDDPAQDLDQTSFRELTRFLATWLRLHKQVKHPHTLLIALHQEERALDATRATDAELYLLGWIKEQFEEGPASPGVRRQVLLTSGYHPKKPFSLFQPTTKSVS